MKKILGIDGHGFMDISATGLNATSSGARSGRSAIAVFPAGRAAPPIKKGVVGAKTHWELRQNVAPKIERKLLVRDETWRDIFASKQRCHRFASKQEVTDGLIAVSDSRKARLPGRKSGDSPALSVKRRSPLS